MSDFYFEKFPTITYKGLKVKDLTRRVRLTEELRSKTNLFLPATVPAQLRPDQISEAYYKDSSLDWLLFLTNEIVDPYYQWPLDELEFGTLIDSKYGSLEIAQQKIKFWRLNWPSDQKKILAQYYDNLPDPLKKYYTPIFNARGSIIQYQRKQEDITCATNKIIQLDGDFSAFAGQMFAKGWKSGVKVGSAQIITATADSLIVNHVIDDMEVGDDGSIEITDDADALSVTVDRSTLLHQAISNDERSFWSAVSYFDVENERNEANKYIIVLDESVLISVLEEIRKKLQ